METKKEQNNNDISGLTSFNAEHRNSLLLSWKIRKGLDNGVELIRIKKYTDWFYDNHIKHHFEDEENYIFPILGNNHKLVKKSLSRHRRLKRLFKDNKNLNRSLNQIEEELEQHVRFEEREVFKAIRNNATPEQLSAIKERQHMKDFIENEEDVFWE